MNWSEAYANAATVGEVWADLPAMVKYTIEPEFPFHPDHLEEGATEAWIAYAIWHALWWRNQVPGVDFVNNRLRYEDEEPVNPVPVPF